MHRRSFLGGLALAALAAPIRSAEIAQPITIGSGGDQILLSRYGAATEGRRPSVVLLHGSRGFELRLRAYERYASALTSEGIDAYLARYYTAADAETIKSLQDKDQREAYESGRYEAWSMRVSSAVAAILNGDHSSDRIGLLGFSLGGYVAAATAARDNHIKALAVLYGGMPSAFAHDVKHTPSMVELHGDADRNVAFAQGSALVRLAKATGASAEQIRYPGKAHGFDFADHDPATEDAVARVARFFREQLA